MIKFTDSMIDTNSGGNITEKMYRVANSQSHEVVNVLQLLEASLELM